MTLRIFPVEKRFFDFDGTFCVPGEADVVVGFAVAIFLEAVVFGLGGWSGSDGGHEIDEFVDVASTFQQPVAQI